VWSFCRDDASIELFFTQRNLALAWQVAGERKQQTFTDFAFSERQWYFVAVTHSNHAKLSFSQVRSLARFDRLAG
jgi:hypothetical protein